MASFASWLRWSLLERLVLPRVPARSPSSADRTQAREDYIGTWWRHDPHRKPPPLPLTKSPSVRCPWKPVRLTFGGLRAISALHIQLSCCSFLKLFITTATVINVPKHSKQYQPRPADGLSLPSHTSVWFISRGGARILCNPHRLKPALHADSELSWKEGCFTFKKSFNLQYSYSSNWPLPSILCKC